MTEPISSSNPAYNPHAQSSAESHQMFEIQFETAVLEMFVSAVGLNGPIEHQVSKLKHGIQMGKPMAELGADTNQLITQINQTIPDQAPFPPFLFTSEGAQVQALTHYAISLEKCLKTLSENGQIPAGKENKLLTELSDLIDTMGQITQAQAYGKLNGIIEEVNTHLPPQHQIPSLITR